MTILWPRKELDDPADDRCGSLPRTRPPSRSRPFTSSSVCSPYALAGEDGPSSDHARWARCAQLALHRSGRARVAARNSTRRATAGGHRSRHQRSTARPVAARPTRAGISPHPGEDRSGRATGRAAPGRGRHSERGTILGPRHLVFGAWTGSTTRSPSSLGRGAGDSRARCCARDRDTRGRAGPHFLGLDAGAAWGRACAAGRAAVRIDEWGAYLSTGRCSMVRG